nr:nucleotide exchange factor GrpE [Pararhodospirillum photometricum]
MQQPTETPDAPEPQTPAEAPGAEPPADPSEDLARRVEALTAENRKLKEDYLRALAEAENARRMADKRIEDNTKYAITNFARGILGVADNLARALSAAPEEARQEHEILRTLAVGVEMTARELENALAKHEVRRVQPLNEPFDPNLHQAVQELEDVTVPSGTVVQVYQDGYTLHGRLLRPAMVVVSRGGPKRETVIAPPWRTRDTTARRPTPGPGAAAIVPRSPSCSRTPADPAPWPVRMGSVAHGAPASCTARISEAGRRASGRHRHPHLHRCRPFANGEDPGAVTAPTFGRDRHPNFFVRAPHLDAQNPIGCEGQFQNVPRAGVWKNKRAVHRRESLLFTLGGAIKRPIDFIGYLLPEALFRLVESPSQEVLGWQGRDVFLWASARPKLMKVPVPDQFVVALPDNADLRGQAVAAGLCLHGSDQFPAVDQASLNHVRRRLLGHFLGALGKGRLERLGQLVGQLAQNLADLRQGSVSAAGFNAHDVLLRGSGPAVGECPRPPPPAHRSRPRPQHPERKRIITRSSKCP